MSVSGSKERFFAELDRVGSVTLAARAIGVNRNTAFGWARAAGRSSHARRAHRGRGEYEVLRATGLTRREAAARVGVNERTARDWDHGVRKIGDSRLYPDGRLVDYARGVTTIVKVPQSVGAACVEQCLVTGLLEALNPGKDESHGSTEEVPGRASGAGDPDGGGSAA